MRNSQEFQGLARSPKSKTKVRPSDAFESGQRAKKNSWARISPYYQAHRSLDHFWFAGYDGATFEKAVEFQVPNEKGNVLVASTV